jgi:hypothetical protein
MIVTNGESSIVSTIQPSIDLPRLAAMDAGSQM